MGRDGFLETRYREVAEEVEKEGGSSTKKGEERHRQGKGLHELVDPKGYGAIRISVGPREKKGKKFVLVRGVGMLIEALADTTGSMGGNVDIAFANLPKTYKLVAGGKKPVLGRYDTQMITAIFGDRRDDYILCRSQAEMDERIAEQMRLMVPERNGHDPTEDPHYGLFGAAYLTKTDVARYGLKHYHFLITDADSREELTFANLTRVFGENVLERVQENGFQFTEGKLPKLQQIVSDLKKSAHAFMLLVGDKNSYPGKQWINMYGADRVIALPNYTVTFLPEVQAAIIGLTEGTLTLQTLETFLVKEANLDKGDAKKIIQAVSHIPLGAQTLLPNFSKLPKKGDEFKTKDAVWPISHEAAADEGEVVASSETGDEGADEIDWK